MTAREQLVAVLNGGEADRTPFSIYDWEMGAVTSDELASVMQQDAWRCLLDRGLGVRHHCPVVRAVEHGVEFRVEETTHGSDVYRAEIKTTPVGSIQKVSRNGWHHEDWIKEPEDYKTQQWIVEHTELLPDYERFARAEDVVGEHGVVVVVGSDLSQHRTPAMKINVDWAGTQQFCMDLAMEVPELLDLYEAQKKVFLEEQRIIAAGPGRFLLWLENLTIEMLGPQRYADFLMSVYREAMPIAEAGDKRVFVHYDGNLEIIADQIADAPFHGIDSLTEPPEGNMMYDVCRAQWPDKVIWANINVELYALPPEEFRQAVIDKRARAGKRGFAFEISEERPKNWTESIPVVLDALAELDP